MGIAKINYEQLNRAVQNAVNGLVTRIIEEEGKAAAERVQARVAAETRGLVARVLSDNRDYGLNPEVNVVISFPDESSR